jgi:hypothetical protein
MIPHCVWELLFKVWDGVFPQLVSQSVWRRSWSARIRFPTWCQNAKVLVKKSEYISRCYSNWSGPRVINPSDWHITISYLNSLDGATLLPRSFQFTALKMTITNKTCSSFQWHTSVITSFFFVHITNAFIWKIAPIFLSVEIYCKNGNAYLDILFDEILKQYILPVLCQFAPLVPFVLVIRIHLLALLDLVVRWRHVDPTERWIWTWSTDYHFNWVILEIKYINI